MTQLTPSQLAILRKRPQSTKLYLSIYQPKIIFQTRVTGSYNPGDAQINYYATATGTYQNIYPNLTARIGTTQGADDVGELRVRNATGTYITFAENEIVWQQNQWLTLIDYINVEAVYPRIIQDPSNQTNVIFYKDYDIPYSNQNTIYGTFPCAGPHRAGFIVTGAYSTYWSSTGTYNVKGDSLTYSWAFEGGTPTGSTSKDPGYVRYTTPGHYKTRLITTSSSGAVDTTYRYISVYQKPNQGTFNPIEAWDITELSGSRGEGGYTGRIKIMSVLPDLQPYALVVIFAEDSYGGNLVSLGGNSQNNESIVFVGYVLQDSIKFNYQQSTMEFDVGSVTEIMKKSEGFSVSCESKASASTWYELTEMTVQKALYHYLRWHSTVLNVNDFQYTGDDRYVQYLDTDRESLFDAVDNFMRKGLLGSVISDRQGKLWAEISHFGLTTPFATIRQGMTLNKQDWMGDPTIQERRNTDSSFIELGGIAYYGVTTNTFSALLSNAPGATPFYHGKAEREEGLILISQAQLNQVAANYLAYKNTQYHQISMPINGNYRNLDITPQEQQYLVVSPSDTIRNVSLQGNPYQIESMNWQYSSVNESFRPDISLEAMATGTMAQTILIPVVPPYVDSGYDYPNLQLPTLPVFNPPDSVGPTSPMVVLVHDVSGGFFYSTDFDSASPHWLQMNGGLTSTQYQAANWMEICPNGSVYCGYVPPGGGLGYIARAPSLGSPWTILYSMSAPGVDLIWSIGIDKSSPERVAYVRGDSATHRIYVGANTSFTAGVVLPPGFTAIMNNGLSYGDNFWILTTFNKYAKITSDGSSVDSTGTPSITPPHLRAGSIGTTFNQTNGIPAGLLKGENNMGTVTTITVTSPAMTSTNDTITFCCDPSGQYLMGRVLVGQRGRSSDGGFSWSPMGNLPVGNYWFAWAGGAGTQSKWIAVGGVVRFSPDFGQSWYNKEGDLLGFLPPAISLDMVRAIVTS